MVLPARAARLMFARAASTCLARPSEHPREIRWQPPQRPCYRSLVARSVIPDYSKDTGAEAFDRIAPRVLVALLGLVLVGSSGWFPQPIHAVWNLTVVGFVLAFLGVQGFWLPFVRPVQLAAALWLAISSFAFGARGPALWTTLAVAAAVTVISIVSGRGRVTSP